jgi:hypothetical protein
MGTGFCHLGLILLFDANCPDRSTTTRISRFCTAETTWPIMKCIKNKKIAKKFVIFAKNATRNSADSLLSCWHAVDGFACLGFRGHSGPIVRSRLGQTPQRAASPQPSPGLRL